MKYYYRATTLDAPRRRLASSGGGGEFPNHDRLVQQIWSDSMLISAGMHDGPLRPLPCVVWLQDWVQISDSAAESDGWCGCLLVTAACHHRYPAADRETGSEGPRGGREGERMEFMVIHRFGGGAGARIISGGASGDKRREFGAAGCRGGCAHGGGPHLWHGASSRPPPRTRSSQHWCAPSRPSLVIGGGE